MQAEDAAVFSVPAGPMGDALAAFSRQSGVQVIADPADLAGQRSAGYAGNGSVTDALDAILAGTPLVARFDDGVAIIRRRAAGTDSPARPQADTSGTTETIVVQGFRSSFASSISTKREADQVLDAITAEEIGQFPDQNIAEAIQRITGVQITRNNGEGETVSVRGLAANFTRVEVNGRTTSVTMDSANPERASVLSVFASDLYNNIEVIKSPTAADVEGGVGGIVRLNTPRPLDIGERRFGLELGYTDAELRDEATPSVTAFYSDVTANERFGFLISGTWEERDRAIDKIQGTQGWDEVDFNGETGRYLVRSRQEQRVGDSEKLNLNVGLQFRVSDNLELFTDLLYTSEDRDEDRARIQIDWNRGTLLDATLDAATGTFTRAEFDRQRVDYRSFTRMASIETQGITSGFNWDHDAWSVHGEASYTSSEEDFVEYRADARVNRDGVGGYDISEDFESPSIFTASTALARSDLDVTGLQLQRRIIALDESDAELDIERAVDGFGPLTSVAFGGRWAKAEYDRLQGARSGDNSGLTLADGDAFVIDGDFGGGNGGAGLLRAWHSVDPVPLYQAHPSDLAFAFDDENLWTISEEVTALYVQANYTFENDLFSARGNGGVRVVQTSYSGQGRINVQTVDGGGNPVEFLLDDAPEIETDYTEVLPSLNAVVTPRFNDNLMFRAAVSRALSRPTINEINPGIEVNTEDGDVVRGNPELNPFTAWQYDFGVEYYFGDSGEGLASATFFYKDVEEFIAPIEYTANLAFPEAGVPAQDFLVSTFTNGGDARIQGVELSLQSPFSFLPEPFNGLGGLVNYTYTDSEFTDANGNAFTFPGASEHSYNIVGYFERGGFSTRLAYNYRDAYLRTQSSEADGSNAEYGADQGRLDFAVRYRFENGLRISFDALNLTDEMNYRYRDIEQRMEDLEFEGRIYAVSLGYVF